MRYNLLIYWSEKGMSGISNRRQSNQIWNMNFFFSSNNKWISCCHLWSWSKDCWDFSKMKFVGCGRWKTPAFSYRVLCVLFLSFTYITIIQHSLWLFENVSAADNVWRGQRWSSYIVRCYDTWSIYSLSYRTRKTLILQLDDWSRELNFQHLWGWKNWCCTEKNVLKSSTLQFPIGAP